MYNYRITAAACTFIFTFLLCMAVLSFDEGTNYGKTQDADQTEGVRIEAPVLSATYDTHAVRRRVTEETSFCAEPEALSETEAEAEDGVSDAVVYVPALEIMSELPLRAEVQIEIEQMCADRDVDPAVVVAMIYHESRYVELAVGDICDSYGLMQIQPRWHQARMDELGVTDLLDGVQNVRVGIDYMDELLDVYGGDYGAALTAYNRGHYNGAVSEYAKAVLATAEEMR